MKKYLVILFALLATCTSPVVAKVKTAQEKTGRNSPLGQARHHLERTLSMLTAKEEGGKGGIGKNKADIPNIVAALTEAEASLQGSTKNTGTGTIMALKFIAEAKTELQTAKGTEGPNLQKAQEAVKEALKRVMQAIQ